MDNIYIDNPHFRKTRLPSLFSDFSRLQQTNAEGFRANIDAWRSVIIQFLSQNEQLSWKYEDLLEKFKYKVDAKVYKPLGLHLVLDHMVNGDHSIVPLSEYTKYSLSTDHTLKANKGVMNTLIGKVWHINYSNTLVSFSSKGNDKEEYMLLEKLIKYSDLIKSLIGKTNDPMDIRQIYDLTKGKINISKSDFEKCLIYLDRDVGELQKVGNNVVILLSKDTEVEENFNYENVSEDLQVMASLNFIIYQLGNHSNKKHKELNDLHEEIIQDLKKDHKLLAKAKQRRSKIIKAQLEDTILKQEQLNILKLKMEQAENNRLVLNAFETNSKVLKKLNLQNTNIDSIINDLMEEIDKTEETSHILSDSLKGTVPLDEDEEEAINDELNVLQREVNNGKTPIHEETDLDELNSKLKLLNIPKHDPIGDDLASESNEESRKQQIPMAI